MEVEEFEKRAKSIVEVELKKITTMVKKISDKNAKEQAKLLGLSTIDEDIKSNPLAFNVLKNFVANMILEQVEGKSGKINYERIISEIVNHIMTFCIGYKAASLRPTKRHQKDKEYLKAPQTTKVTNAPKLRNQVFELRVMKQFIDYYLLLIF